MAILIVDDNAMNVMVIQEMMRRAGYEELYAVYSAMEMFRLLEQPAGQPGGISEKVDLILLDLMMPEMDGIEACRKLRADDRYKDIPVIMVTAIGDSNKLAEALDAGAIDFVTKPINKTELLARIRSALKLKRELDWHKERDSRMRQELTLARQVQESVLPDPVTDGKVRINAYFRASEELAGDLYAWHKIDDGRWAVAVIDAMGHGLSSSLVSMFIASILKEAMRSLWSPRRVFGELNRRLMGLQCDNELIHYYCTGFYFTVDLDRDTLEYANAGHPPGLLFRDGERTAELLPVTCPPLGLFEQTEIVTKTIRLMRGDSIYAYTDGTLSPFEGDDDKQIQQLMTYLGRGSDEGRIQALISALPADGRSDDRCLVNLQLIHRRNEP